MSRQTPPIDWFRSIAPYVKSHRDRTFVVYLGDGVVEHPLLDKLMHDVALLQILGIRLVLVYATRTAIDQKLAAIGIASDIRNGVRVTNSDVMAVVMEVANSQRMHLERQLSMGLPNSPMRGTRLRVMSGNFVTARPVGVVEGIDYQLTGAVRRIDTPGIVDALANDAVVLLPPLGFSPTGEVFNISGEELATATAISMGADKLIMLQPNGGLRDGNGKAVAQCTVADAAALQIDDPARATSRDAACTACSNGVRRTHMLDFNQDGALLEELFTLDGSGTLISEEDFEVARAATLEDIAGVIDLIQPLEQTGVLVRRSRELLEQEIDRFRVLERDGRVVACAALYPFEQHSCGEIACIATDPDYRNGGRGERLLKQLLDEALDQGLNQVFVLTTQTTHWFIEQGFIEVNIDALPHERRELYNLQRNSKVLQLDLLNKSR